MELLYSITIYPFEIILGVALGFLIEHVDSFGIALILLSILVNLLILPLYHVAERWQQEERRTQRAMTPKIKEIKAAYKGYERHALLTTLYRQHDYHPLASLKSALGLLIQIPMLLAAYQLLTNYSPLTGEQFLFIGDLSEPDKLLSTPSGHLNVLPFVMLVFNLLAVFIHGYNNTFRENLLPYTIALIFFIALYSLPSALLLYWTTSNIFSVCKNLYYRYFTSDIEASIKQTHTSPKIHTSIYWLGLCLAIFLPLVSAPMGLLESGSIVDFPEPLMFYMSPLLGIAVVLLIAGGIIFILLPRSFLLPMGVFLSVLALLSTVNLFGFSGDSGDMSHFVFDEGYYVDITERHLNWLVLAITIATVFYMFYVGYSKAIIRSMTLCLLASLSLALSNGVQFSKKRSEIDISSEIQNLFTLSKNGRNVVILMMDRMVAGYLPQAFEILPDLEQELTGFTWYPRTLSQGPYTILGVPTIAGGYDFLARKINNENDPRTLATKLDESFRVLPYNFKKAGFRSSLIQPSSFFNPANKQHLENVNIYHPYNTYHKYWRYRNNINPETSSVHSKLAYFGLFRIAPLAYRRTIYSEGSWLPFERNNNFRNVLRDLLKRGIASRSAYYGGINSERTTAALKNWAIMDDLPLLSEVSETAEDQFYYFSNELVHEPWATRPDLEIELNNPIIFSRKDIQRFGSKTSVQHVYTVAAAMKHIADWIAWLKQQGVYDNTRIIIASDHGKDVFNPMFDEQSLAGDGSLAARKYQAGWFHSTLLVKDFNSEERFKTSNKFMTTADVPWIALENIADGINPYTGNVLAEPSNKLPWVVSFGPWRLEANNLFDYKIEQYFTVSSEDIFKIDNWKKSSLNETLPPYKPVF